MQPDQPNPGVEPNNPNVEPANSQPLNIATPAVSPAAVNPAPVTPAPTPAPAQTQAPTDYHSNPFTASAHGLGKGLAANPLSLITISLIGILLSGAIYFGALLLGAVFDSTALATLLIAIAAIVGILVLIRVSAGLIVLFLASYKGESMTGRQALGSGASQQLNSYILTSILSFIFIFLGFIVFIVPGLYIAGRLSLVGFVIYDEKLSGMKAIKRSWALTKGHVMEMWGVFIAQTLLVSNGLLTMPVSSAGVASRYHEIKAHESHEKPKTHWLNFVLPLIIVLIVAAYTAILAVAFSNTNDDSLDDLYEYDQNQLLQDLFEDTQNDFDYEFNFETN